MLKVRNIPQMRLNITHDTNDGLGNFVSFLPIFNGHGVIYHFLEMSSVLGNNELRALSIILYVFY